MDLYTVRPSVGDGESLHRRIMVLRQLVTIKTENYKLGLRFARDHLDYPEEERDKLIMSDVTMLLTVIGEEKNAELNRKNTIPTMKQGGGNNMLWGYFSVKVTLRVTGIRERKNGTVYHEILGKNHITSVMMCSLRLMKTTDLSHLFKVDNLQKRWLPNTFATL